MIATIDLEPRTDNESGFELGLVHATQSLGQMAARSSLVDEQPVASQCDGRPVYGMGGLDGLGGRIGGQETT